VRVCVKRQAAPGVPQPLLDGHAMNPLLQHQGNRSVRQIVKAQTGEFALGHALAPGEDGTDSGRPERVVALG
jgi:hypothetical protein